MKMLPSKVPAPSGKIPSDQLQSGATPPNQSGVKTSPKGFAGGLKPGKIKA